MAFGSRLTAPVGWCFLSAVPLGVMAAALMGGHYVAAAVGADGRDTATAIGLVILAAAFALNAAGLHATGRVQVVTAGVLVVLLLVAVTSSASRIHSGAFTPFAPHGPGGVVTAASLLFFAFAGWEAATHLSADFTDPRRGLRRATALTAGLVVVLYVGLSVVTIGALGRAAGSTRVPLLALLQQSFGSVGTVLTTGAAVLLTFGAMNAYLASGARLGAALGRDRALPRALVGHTRPGREPRYSLDFLAVCCVVLAGPVLMGALGLDTVVRATSSLLAAVTLVGTVAGALLLHGRRRGTAVAASLFLAVVACCGPCLLVPGVVGAAAVLVQAAQNRRHATGATAPTSPSSTRTDLPVGS